MKDTFTEYIEAENIKFKYAKGQSALTGKEFHTYHEIIWFLGGSAELITETIHTAVSPESLIVIPKETYHQLLINGDPESYFRCVINFTDTEDIKELIFGAMSEVVIIENNKNAKLLLSQLCSNTKHKCKSGLLKSTLTLLLAEIEKWQNSFMTEQTQNPYIIRAIEYINANLTKKITTEQIAKYCNLSASSVSHIFKKEMKISVHSFIVKKRLINAHHRINSGEAATVAAAECGFADYSGFYKQFKKMFGYPPSKRQ